MTNPVTRKRVLDILVTVPRDVTVPVNILVGGGAVHGDLDPAFGARLEDLLTRAGMKKSELARYLQVQPTTVSRYCDGRVPDLGTLRRIAALFKVSLDYLLTGGEASEREKELARRELEAEARRNLDKFLGIVRVPVLGYIRAGSPQWSEAADLGALTLPRELIPEGAEVYALQVVGDSMVGAGLHDGDYVIVRKQDWADPGQIVIARVNHGQEATIKYLVRDETGQYWLRAAHPDRKKYPDIPIREEDDRVQGVLIGKYTTKVGPAVEQGRMATDEGREDELSVERLIELLSQRTGVDKAALRAFLEALKKRGDLAASFEPLPRPPSG